jgi:hypothetical protein
MDAIKKVLKTMSILASHPLPGHLRKHNLAIKTKQAEGRLEIEEELNKNKHGVPVPKLNIISSSGK